MSTSKLTGYLLENPGADFVAAFILALIVVAFVYPFDRYIADRVANFAFFSLVAGVVLQVLALRRKEAQPDEHVTAVATSKGDTMHKVATGGNERYARKSTMSSSPRKVSLARLVGPRHARTGSVTSL